MGSEMCIRDRILGILIFCAGIGMATFALMRGALVLALGMLSIAGLSAAGVYALTENHADCSKQPFQSKMCS